MAWLSSIIVLELWLDEDSLVHNFSSNSSEKGQNCVFLLIFEVSSRFGVLDNSDWVHCIWENSLNVFAEVSVVYKTTALLVFSEELLNFSFWKLDVKSTKACSELKYQKRINFSNCKMKDIEYLRLPLQRFLFWVCRSRWKILWLWFCLWRPKPEVFFQRQALRSWSQLAFAEQKDGNCLQLRWL